MNSNIEVFLANLKGITENDYGDFMRRGNSYFKALQNELSYLEDKNINSKLAEMQNYLQFCPDWDVESTRNSLTRDSEYLDQIIAGHEQEMESKAPDQ